MVYTKALDYIVDMKECRYAMSIHMHKFILCILENIDIHNVYTGTRLYCRYKRMYRWNGV